MRIVAGESQFEVAIQRVDESNYHALASFWDRLVSTGDDAYFHPHEFSLEHARGLARYSGGDVFVVATIKEEVTGYGLLRGWDDGYAVPSLGIAIDSAWRRSGLGRFLMEWLHAAARAKGASRVRLRVHPRNTSAQEFYRRLGYVFRGSDRGELVGTLFLEAGSPPTSPVHHHETT